MVTRTPLSPVEVKVEVKLERLEDGAVEPNAMDLVSSSPLLFRAVSKIWYGQLLFYSLGFRSGFRGGGMVG
jgi:hypothetical protein